MTRIVFILALVCLTYTTAAMLDPTACKITRGGTTAPLAARACGHDVDVENRHDDDRVFAGLNVSSQEEPPTRTIYGNTTVPWEEGETVRIHVLSERSNPQVVFNCGANGMPDICQNMCYGITCKGRPDTLTKNTNTKLADAARRRNQCARPNRCSKDFGGKGKGLQGVNCDEYPFATTLEGQQSPSIAVTRCVPSGQNSAQGGKLKPIADGATFEVRFDFGKGAVSASSGGGTGYCNATKSAARCKTLTGTQLDN
ncbi:uncharacterized protein B0H18DRAFT_1027093 [Fomitopsis serialis]|uniref:uncharacterized protein n=1 Tax=Fomitopsis serialis TaxID=139415 RepID=UPI002008AD69|nr:uncharacterized protein B0H18DRAFT_1027093 [Neoantrodia serialis]KAH9919604.1 hypothetical protein B0H18DRAFT_1027093 [Neoantrodia serialis]